jgi:hypothetical protein
MAPYEEKHNSDVAPLLIFVRPTHNYFAAQGEFTAIAALHDRMTFMQVFTEFRVSEKFYDVTVEGGIDIYLNYFTGSTLPHCIYTSCVGVNNFMNKYVRNFLNEQTNQQLT